MLVTEELVVGTSITCQAVFPPKLVAPCAWYKTPGVPVQLSTILSPLTLTFRFDATEVTAGAGIAARPHSDARTTARNERRRPFTFVCDFREGVVLKRERPAGIWIFMVNGFSNGVEFWKGVPESRLECETPSEFSYFMTLKH